MQWTYDVLAKGALVILFFIKKGKNKQLTYNNNSTALLPSHYQFSNSERAFLSVLEKVVGSNYYVIGKIRAFDVLSFEGNKRSFSKVVQKNFSHYYFDYVVCTVNHHEVVCVVELERMNDKTKLQQIWANFLEKIMQQFCSVSELPRLIVAEQRGYNLNELIDRFEAITELKDISVEENSRKVFVL